MQLTHDNTNFKAKKHPITIVCDSLTKAANVGSLFRIADSFGVQEIIFCNSLIEIPSTKTRKTSRSTEKYINFKCLTNIETTLKELQHTHQIFALEITNKSQPLHQICFNTEKPIAIIIGNEMFGISQVALDIVSKHIHIEMYGQNSSMNVVQACNIALYEIVKQIAH